MIVRRDHRRRLRALAARAGFVIATIVLLLGIVRGGARYFHCAMMGVSMEDACCAKAEPRAHGHEHDAPAIDRPECCSARRLGTLPAGAAVSTPEIASVPLVATLPPFDSAASSLLAPAHEGGRTSLARAGPPPSARERRAQIMTWTC